MGDVSHEVWIDTSWETDGLEVASNATSSASSASSATGAIRDALLDYFV